MKESKKLSDKTKSQIYSGICLGGLLLTILAVIVVSAVLFSNFLG